ncbi:MAG: hypothetical protein ACO3PO_06340 [Limisphaerales bacterium]
MFIKLDHVFSIGLGLVALGALVGCGSVNSSSGVSPGTFLLPGAHWTPNQLVDPIRASPVHPEACDTMAFEMIQQSDFS